MNPKRFTFYWLPVFLYMGLIFHLSSQSHPRVPSFILRWDKISHFFEYGILGFLLIRALDKDHPGKNFLFLKIAGLSIAALYAASDEFHQIFVPGRDATLADWITDSAGAFSGSFFTIKRPALRKA